MRLEKADSITIHNPTLLKKDFFKSASIVTFFSLGSTILSFLTQTILAAKFGTGTDMDAYWAALSLPMLVNTVLIGALNITLVPIFVEYTIAQESNVIGADNIWHLASSLFNLLLISLSVFVASTILFAPSIVRGLLPGFAPESQTFYLTVTLVRIFMPGILFSGLAAFLSSIYYAQNRFFVPAIVPAVNAACVFIGAWLWSGRWGVIGVAFGFLLGAIVQFIFTASILLRPQRYHLCLNLRHQSIQQILSVMAPWIIGSLISKSNPLLDRFLASTLSAGSISYLGYAYTLNQVLILLVSKGISVVIFPQFSRQATQRNWNAMSSQMTWTMELIGLLILPIVVIVILFNQPIIQVLYERGSFTSEATNLTGSAWIAYLGAFVASSLGVVVSYVLYALKNTMAMMKISLWGFCLNVILALLLTRWIGYLGPAIAFSITAFVNFVLALNLIHRQLKIGVWGEIRSQIFRWGSVFFICMLLGWLLKGFLLYYWHPISLVKQISWLTIVVLIMSLIYITALWVIQPRPIAVWKAKYFV
ncbi:MAG: murein biosynthesis integral membrane protein MurJ [Chloroflexi bacterium]|nr:murein biosynthesis integral membrane protein MurJ [Chloroflexota bacterium]